MDIDGKIKETGPGVTLEQQDRGAWEEIHKVWHEIMRCVDKVDQFLRHLKMCTLKHSGDSQIPIHDVSKLHSKLANVMAITSILAKTYETASCNDIFVQPFTTCKKLVAGKKQSTTKFGMIVLAVVIMILAYGNELYGAMGIKNTIFAGVVVGPFAIGVLVYIAYAHHSKRQKFEKLVEQRQQSVKTAQETMSNFSYEVQTLNRSLLAMFDLLPACDQNIETQRRGPDSIQASTQLQPQQQSVDGSYWIVRFFRWCVTPVRRNK